MRRTGQTRAGLTPVTTTESAGHPKRLFAPVRPHRTVKLTVRPERATQHGRMDVPAAELEETGCRPFEPDPDSFVEPAIGFDTVFGATAKSGA